MSETMKSYQLVRNAIPRGGDTPQQTTIMQLQMIGSAIPSPSSPLPPLNMSSNVGRMPQCHHCSFRQGFRK